ncbi:FtsP/CotA-like multicopper oxidase with cupredoxin domain [Cryobacterium sp. CG_9.6]|nr:FtsP/CotA-like multicopper oxidase with cupredoxin domain [Cryobacterium sp. CG_9.6]
MRPITRRTALLLGGVGAASVAVGATGLTLQASTLLPAELNGGAELTEPTELRSSGGALTVDLEATAGQLSVAGRTVQALGYNGGTPGPTLRMRAGDTVNVSLRNGLTDPSNLHVHGLHVSPENNGDNMFVTVPAGDSFDYEYTLPADHPPGVFWYHPHHHGFVTDQVFGGLFGAIIVDDPDPIPATRERVLIISDVTLTAGGTVATATAMQKMSGREGELVLVNGQLSPRLTAQPGDRERWRIVNACVSRYLRLRLDGQQMSLLGIDSGRFASPREVAEIVLAPGNRADVLVTAAEGTSALHTLAYDRGNAGGMMGGGSTSTADTTLATLNVAGEVAAESGAIPRQRTPRDLRSAAVTARRELVFAMGMGGMGGGMMSPTINGRAFDASRDDETVQFGSVEEWLLTNTSNLDHPLHLHVWPMQIVEQNGQAVDSVI